MVYPQQHLTHTYRITHRRHNKEARENKGGMIAERRGRQNSQACACAMPGFVALDMWCSWGRELRSPRHTPHRFSPAHSSYIRGKVSYARITVAGTRYRYTYRVIKQHHFTGCAERETSMPSTEQNSGSVTEMNAQSKVISRKKQSHIPRQRPSLQCRKGNEKS